MSIFRILPKTTPVMRALFLSLFILLAANAAIAQTSRGQSEISVSCGFNSFQQTMQSNFGFGSGSEYTKVTSASVCPFITYRYYVTDNLALGLTGGQQQMSTAHYDDTYNNAITPYQKTSYKYTTIATELLLNYSNNPRLRAYTYLGLGCSQYQEQRSQANYNSFQVYDNTQVRSFNMEYVPIGLSFGGMLSGFAEIGIGYKGFVNCGMSYRFPYHTPDRTFKYRRLYY